jgi:small subunit ribosomal protein S12
MINIFTFLKKKIDKKTKKKRKALESCPQKRGVCLKVMTMTPRKPNSALRQVARVRLSTGRRLIIFIPGEGFNNLKIHSSVLVAGIGARDIPGSHYHAVRGILDLQGVQSRKKGRSKYGTKKIKKSV